MRQFPHYIKGLDPVADAFSGTVYTDIVSMDNHKLAEFIIYKGVGTTGTSTITVEACDDTSASNTSAVAFNYQAITSGDTAGALTAVTSTGFTTTAGSSQIYVIYVDADALLASGYKYVRLKAVESVDNPVLGGILINLREPRYNQAVQTSAID
jgi:hypothetical protein